MVEDIGGISGISNKQCLSNVFNGNSIAYMSTVYNLRYGIKYVNVILTNPLNMIFLDR
jgi:hypothetical protein